MTDQVLQREQLGTLTKIGQGGQGIVYQAPKVSTKFAAAMVYKEYKPQFLAGVDFTALAAMPVLVEQSQSYAEGQHLISIAAWPCRLVEGNGSPTGFVMPAIPEAFTTPLTTVKGVEAGLAEFQLLLNDDSILTALGITIDDVKRYALLRETASALKFLHQHGVCVGDISPKNLLFSLTPKAGVYFIDCDTMRVNDISPLPQAETPGWEAPKGEELSTIYSDAYKLGLLALRLLAGDQDTKNPQRIPATTPHVLSRIITDTLTAEPRQRPLPEAWTHILGYAIEEAQHQKSTTPTTPAIAPPTPRVRSRTSTSTSTSTPPPPPPSEPPPTPTAAVPDSQPVSGATVAVAVVAAIIIAALIFLVIKLIPSNTGSSSTASPTSTKETTSYGGSYSTPRENFSPTTQGPPPMPSFTRPPNLLQGPDQSDPPDDRCINGYPLANGRRVGPAPPNSDGTFTSCVFAISTGNAYLTEATTPGQTVRVNALGMVSCSQVQQSVPAVQCASTDPRQFLMNCAMGPTDQWITCTGGNEAIVYIF